MRATHLSAPIGPPKSPFLPRASAGAGGSPLSLRTSWDGVLAPGTICRTDSYQPGSSSLRAPEYRRSCTGTSPDDMSSHGMRQDRSGLRPPCTSRCQRSIGPCKPSSCLCEPCSMSCRIRHRHRAYRSCSLQGSIELGNESIKLGEDSIASLRVRSSSVVDVAIQQDSHAEADLSSIGLDRRPS